MLGMNSGLQAVDVRGGSSAAPHDPNLDDAGEQRVGMYGMRGLEYESAMRLFTRQLTGQQIVGLFHPIVSPVRPVDADDARRVVQPDAAPHVIVDLPAMHVAVGAHIPDARQ